MSAQDAHSNQQFLYQIYSFLQNESSTRWTSITFRRGNGEFLCVFSHGSFWNRIFKRANTTPSRTLVARYCCIRNFMTTRDKAFGTLNLRKFIKQEKNM